jgi:hypothetical protein
MMSTIFALVICYPAIGNCKIADTYDTLNSCKQVVFELKNTPSRPGEAEMRFECMQKSVSVWSPTN